MDRRTHVSREVQTFFHADIFGKNIVGFSDKVEGPRSVNQKKTDGER